MNECDWAIMEALEMFNKALKSAKKPKIRKRYPIYPPKPVARKRAWK